jgi:hypothetical protein
MFGYNTPCVNPQFEPLRKKTDQTGLELRKSLRCKALRILSAESIVTKRVALAELFLVANFSATRQLTHNAESESFLRFAFYASSGNDLRRRSES